MERRKSSSNRDADQKGIYCRTSYCVGYGPAPSRSRKPVLDSLRDALTSRGWVALVFDFAAPKGITETFKVLGSQQIGIGGPVTYERANRLRGLVARMPLEYLLLETDAPDQPDSGIRGQRNEPARLSFVCDTIARLRGEDVAAIGAATTANAERLFNL